MFYNFLYLNLKKLYRVEYVIIIGLLKGFNKYNIWKYLFFVVIVKFNVIYWYSIFIFGV